MYVPGCRQSCRSGPQSPTILPSTSRGTPGGRRIRHLDPCRVLSYRATSDISTKWNSSRERYQRRTEMSFAAVWTCENLVGRSLSCGLLLGNYPVELPLKTTFEKCIPRRRPDHHCCTELIRAPTRYRRMASGRYGLSKSSKSPALLKPGSSQIS
jgi:hypothetical protein